MSPLGVYSKRKKAYVYYKDLLQVFSNNICSSPKLKTASVFISRSQAGELREGCSALGNEKRLPQQMEEADVHAGSCTEYLRCPQVLVNVLADQSFQRSLHVVEEFQNVKRKKLKT